MDIIKTRYRNISLIFLLGLISHINWAQQTDPLAAQELEQKMDSIFQEYHESDPGAVVSVIHEGKIQLAKAYGMANLEYDIPNKTNTKFHVASISKQFTAFSILLLQDQGKLSLDDDIRKYIPEVPDFGHPITLRHLASHTSGLRDQWNLLLLMGVRLDDVINNDHILALIAEQKELNFVPGEEFLYCNTGYSLLAEVVARVSGQSFAAFTEDNIFRPLQMDNTVFVDDFEKIYKNRAYSYYNRGGDKFNKRVLSFGNTGPSNLLTTVEDLSLWILNFDTPKVGNPEIFRQMVTEVKLNNGKTFGGGLGLFMGKRKDIDEIQHGGADAGFRAHISMFPTKEFGVIVLSNFGQSDPQSLAYKISDLYLSHDYVEEKLSDIETKAETPFNIDPGRMKEYVGHYWTKEHAYSRNIYLKNDTLMHFRTQNNESALLPIGEDEFKVMNVPVDARVRFERLNGEMKLIETVNKGIPILLEKFIPVEYSEKDWQKFEGIYYSNELKTSYAMKWQDNKLTATHIRMGTIDLRLVKHNFFVGNRGFFGSVEFIRDGEENVTGFLVSNGRVRNLLFEKIRIGK